LTGRVADRNGPWLADQLLELGVELAHITICGDRAADIEAQLRFMADEGVDLIVTSGGLGPTADDMTVEVVARFCGRELVLDAEVENKIANILKKLMAHFNPGDFDAVRAANRKQAMIPAGSQVLDPVGTAPGVVVPGKPTVIARRPSGFSGCPSRGWPKPCAAPRHPFPGSSHWRSLPAYGVGKLKWSPATNRTPRTCTPS
jgi:nicotinamide-nucleotide amidase